MDLLPSFSCGLNSLCASLLPSAQVDIDPIWIRLAALHTCFCAFPPRSAYCHPALLASPLSPALLLSLLCTTQSCLIFRAYPPLLYVVTLGVRRAPFPGRRFVILGYLCSPYPLAIQRLETMPTSGKLHNSFSISLSRTSNRNCNELWYKRESNR